MERFLRQLYPHTLLLDVGENYYMEVCRNIQNPFWKNVIKSWGHYVKNIHQTYKTPHDVLLQPLWYNSKINIEYNKHWYNSGLKYVKDLYGENGQFIRDFNTIKQYYRLNGTFLDYFQLIRNMPILWTKININELNLNYLNVHIPLPLKLLFKHKKGCRHIYKQLSSNNQEQKHWSKLGWERELHCELDTQFWSSVYSLPILCTLEMKLREFQYKVLKQILYTNYKLYKIKLVDSDKCDFCGDIGTIIHMLCNCDAVKPLWSSLRIWLNKSNIPIQNLSNKDIICGIPTQSRLVNHLILIMKYFIYRNNINKQECKFDQFLNSVRYYKEIEYYIACKNKKTDTFLGKWAIIFHNID